ncbi:gtp-binding protein lepa [Phaffia rhodozyma]|uniref:Gtp-binding protein lepa n=1 Tax=Phaffia rhodozyma TaxID=264483 RepID=A0A0F7SUZ2_PHARH|nr:gtp-binding protein lepa [Phaffia rhodozyma]
MASSQAMIPNMLRSKGFPISVQSIRVTKSLGIRTQSSSFHTSLLARPFLAQSPSTIYSSRRLLVGSSTCSIYLSGKRSLTSSSTRSYPPKTSVAIDMAGFPPEMIRNFSVIAHIDHGKSTLSDRLLELTGTIKVGEPGGNQQVLDKLKVERERGITVKAQTVSMIHEYKGKKYLLNLIDTPGHVDFSYEVSRSLAACEGALLLVDCTQGVQAQTISVHGIAFDNDLEMIPVINKVDLAHASPTETINQIHSLFGLEPSSVLPISAKTGKGVQDVLTAIIERIPPPVGKVEESKFRGLVIDSEYDRFRGVVSLVAVKEGTIKKGDKIESAHSGKKYEVLDIGILHPEEERTNFLTAGQVGYIVCNMKAASEATVGDTFHIAGESVEALPGFKPTKAMVFAGIYPIDSNDFYKLEESVHRLMLSDRSVTIERESSQALGVGLRLGCLGTLHMDVFRQRLEDEYNSDVIITAPSVPYKITYVDGKTVIISNPNDFPDVVNHSSKIQEVAEPMINATILVPEDYIGPMMELCVSHRGVQTQYSYLDAPSISSSSSSSSTLTNEQVLQAQAAASAPAPGKSVSGSRAILKYKIPMAEMVQGFFDELKSLSSGFASLDYEDAGWEPSDVCKMNLHINGKPIDALSMIIHRGSAISIGREWTSKLRTVLPRQQYDMSIQSVIGTKIISSEKVTAMRKDVTAGLYGGHFERKLKHLNKQKEGKKRLKKYAGNIELPQEAFFSILSSNGGKKR